MDDNQQQQQQEVPTLNTADLLGHALEGNPSQASDTFNELMLAKIAAAIDDKKAEIASRMFDDGEPEEEETEELEQQEDEEENENTEQDA